MAKNVSNNFKNIIKNGGPFYSYAVMTLADGTVIELTSENDFSISGSGYSEDSERGFPLGVALSKAITLNLDNTITSETLKDTESVDILDIQGDEITVTDKSAKRDYYYARIALYTEANLPDGKIERIREGIFTVIDSVAPGDVLEITAYDDMYKSDVEFVSALTYPVSAQMLLNEVCNKCGITLGSATFQNNDFQIQQAPEGLTGRQVIGYIAQIAVGNAVIDSSGRLIIKSYDFSGFDKDEEVAAGEVETGSGIHIISEYTANPSIGTDNVTITGVSVTIESEDYEQEDENYIVGSETYALSIDNPLIKGKEKEAVDLIAEKLIGVTVRPFSGDFFPDPSVEFMDLTYLIDRKDNVYKTFITTHDFTYLGSSSFSCGMESPERHGGSYYSTASEIYQKAKDEIKNNKTQWEQAIENLTQQVANASGFYTTTEEQDDGSIIFYLHNKPTLEESNYVWKMTSETLSVSTDGGEHWNGGITVNGEVIAKIMNTIGLNFDWGVGGTLIIEDTDGNETFYVDAETGQVRIVANSFSLKGKSISEIADEEVNDFVDNVYSPTIANLQSQIDTAVNELDASLNQEGVFNRLTNNGTVQGIFLEDGDLYINATYIKSGTLTLGGTNNQYGKLSIRNASNKEIGRWNKDGVYIYGGEIYSNADDSEASIVGGRIYVSHTGTDLGQIGANFFSSYESYKGITFGLRTSGSYMSWGAQESSYGDYVVKLLYSSKNFSDFLADTLYVGCNMDFRDYYIQNAVIDGFSCKNSFKIPNNTDCNIYSDVNFHNWEIQNVKIDNLLAINGYTTENGTFRVVTSITNRADGGINWTSGYVTIRDGIITSWPS